jgi:plastocyanin domain-containing protein
MDTTEWLVIGLGLVAIGWINWWFLLAPRAVARAITTDGVQQVTTSVELVPEQAGTYEFTCGMRMLRGRLTVEEAETAR